MTLKTNGKLNERRKVALWSLERRLSANPDWWNPHGISKVAGEARKLAESEAKILRSRIKQ